MADALYLKSLIFSRPLKGFIAKQMICHKATRFYLPRIQIHLQAEIETTEA